MDYPKTSKLEKAIKYMKKVFKERTIQYKRDAYFIFQDKREIVPHHDSRTNSHYQISQRALRDARRY